MTVAPLVIIIFYHFLCSPRGIIHHKISIIGPATLKGILNGLDVTPEYLLLVIYNDACSTISPTIGVFFLDNGVFFCILNMSILSMRCVEVGAAR